MRHVYQMYRYTKFVYKKVTYAENHREPNGDIPYPKRDDLYKEYATKHRRMTESKAAHLQAACIESGYLRRDSFNSIFLEDGKGADFLDSLLGLPVGLIQEVLERYHSTIAFFFGATFIGAIVFLWSLGGEMLPHIVDFLKHHL